MGLLASIFGFDKKFRKNIHKYDKESYVRDLKSKDKDKKIRAIWGIEGMRNNNSIEELQKIVNNKNEDKWVRKEAEIAIKNLKKNKSK